jgi:tripartite ATP-independent transporter DctP family solute receptor
MTTKEILMKKRFFTLAAAALLGIFACTAARAGTLFTVSHTLESTSHYHKGLLYLHDLLQKKSGGDLGLVIYPSSQFTGFERNAIEAVRTGKLDMTLSSSAPFSYFTKAFMVFDLPFIITDLTKAYAWMDGPRGRELLDSLAPHDMVGLSIWENGFRHLTNSRRAIVGPEDVRGLKIRVMENAVHLATFKTLNAYPTPMPFGILFGAMQRNRVDGQENPLVIIFTSGFYEVQKYLTLSGHFYAPAVLVVNRDVWDNLTDAQRGIMTEAVAEARDWERAYSRETDSGLVDELRDRGMEILHPDKTLWARALMPVYNEFAPVIGQDVMQSLIDAQK